MVATEPCLRSAFSVRGSGFSARCQDQLEELFELVAEDADHFGCEAEMVHARTIVKRGTSADRQLARYEAVKGLGGTEQAALMAVVDGIVEETMIPPSNFHPSP